MGTWRRIREARLERAPGRIAVCLFALAALLSPAVLPSRPAAAGATQPEAGWVVNEIHADPDPALGDANGDGVVSLLEDEFIELVNVSGAAEDVGGWQLLTEGGASFTIPAGITVPNDCPLLLFGGGAPTGSFGHSVVLPAQGFGLRNAGETITLTNASGVVQATLTFGPEAGDNQSITRDPDLTGEWVKHTLASSSFGNRYSPGTKLDGRPFDGCPVPDTPPAVLEVRPAHQTTDAPLDEPLTVTFSESVSLAANAVELVCETSGMHAYDVSGGPITFSLLPSPPFASSERCVATIFQSRVTDNDTIDPPDRMAADFVWEFRTVRAVADHVLINEVDAYTSGAPNESDFIELYDGSQGRTDLSGLLLTLYDGSTDTISATLELDGQKTNRDGYFVLGGQAVAGATARLPAGWLPDGPAALALYAAEPDDLPIGRSVTTDNLIDAVVFGADNTTDEELLALLYADQPQVNENGRGAMLSHSVQRCPNGAGGRRQTAAYRPGPPSPQAENVCEYDLPPSVTAVSPADGATDVPLDTTLSITFSEEVTLEPEAFTLDCSISGRHEYTLETEEATVTLRPAIPLTRRDRCVVWLYAHKVHDRDVDDPPDSMAADYTWAFTAAAPVATHMVINEVDADTPGHDTAEFVELFDGSQGHTDLSGLVLVFFNGTDDVSYRSFDLNGYETDEAGYFLLANAAVPGADLIMPDNLLQNGADAVALFQGASADFPNGTPVTASAPLDAVVYGTGQVADEGLLGLLNANQPQVNEDGRSEALTHSNQRCPNGSGGQRNTTGFKQNTPTPKAPSDCLTDTAPGLSATVPPDDGRDFDLSAALQVTFNEPVQTAGQWLELTCTKSGAVAVAIEGGPVTFTIRPARRFQPEDSCTATVRAQKITDVDADDPPDEMAGNYTWRFRTAPPLADHVVINEVDSDTPGVDGAEFIELYDGGAGNTRLHGLVVVLFNGSTDTSYAAYDLDGMSTDSRGYFILGNASLPSRDLTLPDGLLQNGPDAVALYGANAADFPNGRAVVTAGLVDAVVYGSNDEADSGLLRLLNPGQPQTNESGRGSSEDHSSQRCPNGGGGRRNTAGFKQNRPTPGAPSDCLTDSPPEVVGTHPSHQAEDVDATTALMVTFNEPVRVESGWLALECSASGRLSVTTSGGPTTFNARPSSPFRPLETCRATVVAQYVTDQDADDPPDRLASDISWSFSIAPPVADYVLINEVDSDTLGTDNAEFIELYDGGAGRTNLQGLVLVLYNGFTDASYAAFDLDGYMTDGQGYFVLGDDAVAGRDLTLPDGLLQNGPDAVALYAGSAVDFPNGSGVTKVNLLDAIVYAAGDAADPELMALLNIGQPQVNEDGRGRGDEHSNQRCPNGAGGQRNTAGYKQNPPTPELPNNCITDVAPLIVSTAPGNLDRDIELTAAIVVTFSEPVEAADGWLNLSCDSGKRAIETTGGPTTYTARPTTPLPAQESCTATVLAQRVSDLDSDDPPDNPTSDYVWSFTTAPPVAENVLINELDSDTPGTDSAEFIELFDGGVGRTSLRGLALVFYNGNDDLSYAVFDLDGHATDERGYFILGNAAIAGVDMAMPNGLLQNGPDAVALYAGNAADFQGGRSITTSNLLDAVVYGTNDEADAGLTALLNAGQPQADEAGRGSSENHSLQRCPNGTGGGRNTAGFRQNLPTPGAPSDCRTDSPPAVTATTPVNEATSVSLTAPWQVTFSEAVATTGEWFSVDCAASGRHPASVAGGPVTFTLTPIVRPAYGERCAIRLHAAMIRDVDADDPPDHPEADFTWSFTMVAPPADFILINEIDADTPGVDAAEFIELFDGGRGGADLSGLSLVFYNGHDDKSYKAVDLDGLRTDSRGYFLLANPALPRVDLVLPAGTLQNGPDAVALYVADAADFPSGTPPKTAGLLDALVYHTGDPPDPELLALLETGQSAADESGRGDSERDANGRCPNGSGGMRRTSSYRPVLPTPGSVNNCAQDDAPAVVGVQPASGATGVPVSSRLEVLFSEPVEPEDGWLVVECSESGSHQVSRSGGPERFTLTPATPFLEGETCHVTVKAARIHDVDPDDPPDNPIADFDWRFSTEQIATPDIVIINEFDANTPGADAAEFIELYDGGVGRTDLSGLVLVFYNGSDDRAYQAINLDGVTTDAQGYAVIGNADVPHVLLAFSNGALQNGPDGIALYAGSAAAFPDGTAIRPDSLRDAVVYGPPDEGLLPLLTTGQTSFDEGARGSAEEHAGQRCPNGQGGRRRPDAYLPNPPTPGAPNDCRVDTLPRVTAVAPTDGAENVGRDARLSVTFSEAVTVDASWLTVNCEASGELTLTTTGGPQTYHAAPLNGFAPGESCRAAVDGRFLSDNDLLDPPDRMEGEYVWNFTIARQVADFVLINELDADTPGVDQAEFLELFDGGRGQTDLSGLILVLFNGATDGVYRVIDLQGRATNSAGYFVIGAAAVPSVDLIVADGTFQNGADAVALYAADAGAFPSGSPPVENGLVDAIVYGTGDEPDSELLAVLTPGQPQIDEAAGGKQDEHAIQRCPNGEGGPRHTQSFLANPPTPQTANDCRRDDAPRVATVSPPPGASAVPLTVALNVVFSEPIAMQHDWITLSCSRSGDHDLETGGGPLSFTVEIKTDLQAGERCAAIVHADRVQDADEQDPPDTMSEDYTWAFAVADPVCGEPATPIHLLQGNGETSPRLGEPDVIIEGVVVGTLDGGHTGYYVQEETADWDNSPATSEAILVRFSGEETLETGDLARLSGAVAEPDDRTALEAAQLIAVCAADRLPEPVDLALPLSEQSWESLEGMLVRYEDALTIVDNTALAGEGLLRVSPAGRSRYPTEYLAPGPEAAAQLAADRAQMVIIDDNLTLGPPDFPSALLGLSYTVRLGDDLGGVSAFVDQVSGYYRLRLTQAPHVIRANARPTPPGEPAGRIRIAYLDAGYYLNGDGHGGGFPTDGGASSPAELARQRDKLVAALDGLRADVIAVTGIENDGYGPESAAIELLAALNALSEATSYRAAVPAVVPADEADRQPVIFYRVDKVTPQAAGATLTLAGARSDQVYAALAQSFRENDTGEIVTIVTLTLPPRDACPGDGGADDDQGDGQACGNDSRETAVVSLLSWLAGDPAHGQDEDVLILGNFNSLRLEEPIGRLRDAGYEPMGNPDYSAAWQGYVGGLHHALAGSGLMEQINSVRTWHANADEAPALDYRLSNPAPLYRPDAFRSSPFDAILVDVTLDSLRPSFTSNGPVWVGEMSYFAAAVSGSGDLDYTWDWGDETPPGSGRNAWHRYARPGSYQVTLTVGDGLQSRSVTGAHIVLPRSVFLPMLPQR